MKVENLVPEVYYKESRDFAYLGRLFEILFNYIKTASDLVSAKSINEHSNSLVVDLIVDTLGFKTKHKYITRDLISIASMFIDILRNKGSDNSINEVIQVLLNSQKIKGNKAGIYLDKKSGSDNYDWVINIPSDMEDTILLEDLFDYILPAGVTYQLVTTTFAGKIQNTTINMEDINKVAHYTTSQLGQVANEENSNEDYVEGADRSTFYTGVVSKED